MIIDSIFRNFYIPPVIFAVKVHDDGSETKTCIDGKQRLTSVHRYASANSSRYWRLTTVYSRFMDGIVRVILSFQLLSLNTCRYHVRANPLISNADVKWPVETDKDP
jgi:hypothetical protein